MFSQAGDSCAITAHADCISVGRPLAFGGGMVKQSFLRLPLLGFHSRPSVFGLMLAWFVLATPALSASPSQSASTSLAARRQA